mmetsp:Transcript_21839/g.33816  ORF Transcript_21839/g.33816 Transcript_21839/m.33816 type:complete len:90 (+) Transcript_21839:727-996(+)
MVGNQLSTVTQIMVPTFIVLFVALISMGLYVALSAVIESNEDSEEDKNLALLGLLAFPVILAFIWISKRLIKWLIRFILFPYSTSIIQH